MVLTTLLIDCRGLDGTGDLPAGTRDPSTYNTAAGALQLARGAVTRMRAALPLVVDVTGLFTDELDERFYAYDFNVRIGQPQGLTGYAELQQARGQASLARAYLTKYAPNSSPAERGEMYALEGYADLYLADMFCSGVPLSTLDFDGSFTYKAGSSTAEVYEAAAGLLDSAIAVSHDSIAIDALARVGLGRALLAMGARDSAARVVASVPDSASYVLRVAYAFQLNDGVAAGNREGHNGLYYGAGTDPRTPMGQNTFYYQGNPFVVPWPSKYAGVNVGDSISVVMANGIEARLIEAEAAIAHGGMTWLTILNRLRTDGTFTTAVRRDATSGDSIGVDTTWHAGVGGVDSLRPLQDPGSDSARVSMVFQERGYWLYLTGHRQGDLRRLVRATTAGGYGRPQYQVYPVGATQSGSPYGDAVTIPIPDGELSNPKYKGCLNHGA